MLSTSKPWRSAFRRRHTTATSARRHLFNRGGRPRQILRASSCGCRLYPQSPRERVPAKPREFQKASIFSSKMTSVYPKQSAKTTAHHLERERWTWCLLKLNPSRNRFFRFEGLLRSSWILFSEYLTSGRMCLGTPYDCHLERSDFFREFRHIIRFSRVKEGLRKNIYYGNVGPFNSYPTRPTATCSSASFSRTNFLNEASIFVDSWKLLGTGGEMGAVVEWNILFIVGAIWYT